MSEHDPVADVWRWFRTAEEDLEAAEALLHDDSFIPRHVCGLSQQAAEKAIKGLLTAAQTPFPSRHDLDALRNLLPEDSITKREHPDLAELTEWAVEARYPGDWQEATVEDAQRAARQARAVFESALSDLFERGIRRTAE